MTERERLIELILKCNANNALFECFSDRPRYRQAAEILADYLLDNGVVVPVRCEECVHAREKNEKEKLYLVEDTMICTHPEVSEESWCAVFCSHWCSYGERRADNGT